MTEKSVREQVRPWGLERVFGSMPWLKPIEKQHFRVKIFKSGNSLAVRLPAGLGLQAGTEMELEVEDGQIFTLEPVDRPKRKFNIAKVCGSAVNLRPIKDGDRAFKERLLIWPIGDDRDPT